MRPVQQAHSYVPQAGFVPNETVATKIAVAVLSQIYGAEQIERQHPLHATQTGDVWVIEGSLRPGWIGGVAHIEISRTDGRILRVSHGR